MPNTIIQQKVPTYSAFIALLVSSMYIFTQKRAPKMSVLSAAARLSSPKLSETCIVFGLFCNQADAYDELVPPAVRRKHGLGC